MGCINNKSNNAKSSAIKINDPIQNNQPFIEI